MFAHTGMTFSEAFAFFDKDSNSALDKDEIRHILDQTSVDYTQEELQMLMDRYSAGGITIEEFRRTFRVERNLLLKYAKEKEKYRAAFAELPVVVLFFYRVCVTVVRARVDVDEVRCFDRRVDRCAASRWWRHQIKCSDEHGESVELARK